MFRVVAAKDQLSPGQRFFFASGTEKTAAISAGMAAFY
jgi:hypothetical protein